MIDLFNNSTIDKTQIICHSGGAEGSDTYFSQIGIEFGVKTFAYSYKTKYHNSDDKVEISEDDYSEGVIKITNANKILCRYGISKYMNLLARNWAQVKYSSQTFAIGTIVKPGVKTQKGYVTKSKFETVEGGTGYAVQMSIDHIREVFVFDQVKLKWFKWSYSALKFVQLDVNPKITCQNFAGIGTRQINEHGVQAIRQLYENTFN